MTFQREEYYRSYPDSQILLLAAENNIHYFQKELLLLAAAFHKNF